MKLEAGKEMDRKCVLDWLNEVYITPSLSYSEYTDEEIRIFAHDAIVLLNEQQPKTGHWATKRTLQHDGEWYCDQCEYEPTVFENTPFCPNCGAKMEGR